MDLRCFQQSEAQKYQTLRSAADFKKFLGLSRNFLSLARNFPDNIGTVYNFPKLLSLSGCPSKTDFRAIRKNFPNGQKLYGRQCRHADGVFGPLPAILILTLNFLMADRFYKVVQKRRTLRAQLFLRVELSTEQADVIKQLQGNSRLSLHGEDGDGDGGHLAAVSERKSHL